MTSWALQQFARAPIAKYHKLDSSTNSNLLSHQIRNLISRCQQVWFLSRPLSLACICCLLIVCLHSLSSVHTHPQCLAVCPNFLFLQGQQSDWIWAHSAIYLTHLYKGPVSKYSHILRYWGLSFQHLNLGRDIIQSITGTIFLC